MSDIKPQGTQAYGVETGYEHSDANVRSVVTGLGIILVSTFVVMAGMLAMFNFLNHRYDARDAQVPALVAQPVVPPEPRLLPMPYTDEYNDVTLQAERNAGKKVTPDGFPWDKRNLEIVDQHDEANSYKALGNGRYAIPVARAMEIMANDGKEGTPAVMSWQPEYARWIAGEKDGGIALDPKDKRTSPATFDDKPLVWESPDEKYTVESSGGTSLKAGGLSR